MVAPAGRALFFHAEAAPSAELDVEAKRGLLEALRAVAAAERAVRSAERANMVM
jgi:hypothetical protein